jgi:hypothetical protein
MCRDFPMAKTSLGIVAAEFAHTFVSFAVNLARLRHRGSIHMEENPAASSRCYGIPKPLCKAVDKKVYTCEEVGSG